MIVDIGPNEGSALDTTSCLLRVQCEFRLFEFMVLLERFENRYGLVELTEVKKNEIPD